jgi:hypothetical protein
LIDFLLAKKLMHIKEIKISNLLSFPYKEDFENMEKISFFSNG